MDSFPRIIPESPPAQPQVTDLARSQSTCHPRSKEPATMSLEPPMSFHNGAYEVVRKQSSSPEPHDGNQAGGKHRRNYQACDRCRSRKVKCDLGPVDAPHPPPCARCQRERAECIFATQRKKDRRGSEERDEDDANSNKRRRVDDSPVPIPRYPSIGAVVSGRHSSLPNIDPGLQGIPAPTSNPVYRSPPGAGTQGTGRQAFNNGNFDRHPVKSEDKEVRSSGAESTFTTDPSRTTQDNLLTVLMAAQKIDGFDGDPKKLRDYHRSAAGGPDVPAEQPLSPEQRQERERILNVWRAARYVRAGWFTAEEALRYVEYFYTHLHPMTPVDVTEFRSPRRHLALLTEEPVLAVAILTISSRYMKLSGRSSDTRAHKIHERLWASLMELVQRLIWGQEQFGGGFTGAGVSRVRESASGQITWPGSLRTLGTIEALLLLSDWQPRSLHFPPDDDDNHLLNINYDKLPATAGTNGNGGHGSSLDALPYASWLEPAWRSDKMCWMLMSLAQGLSSEMGVFDTNEIDGLNITPSLEQQRKNRIRRMVLVYVAQISGRNGITCPVQLSPWDPSHDYGKTAAVDQMQSLWVHIASIMNRANREIFPSRQFTRELTSGLKYRDSIDTFARLLRTWKQHFEDVKSSLQEPMLSILEMEYEYARLYINSLGLQNVVESWMRTGPHTQNSMSSVAKVVSDNKHYIHEVTQASVHILEIVSNTLGTNHYLRDAPIRVFLRCLSAMMFILKRLSLGNHERMVRKCLDLLDGVCLLLAREVVDDVHLCAQTSVLIQSIVKHVKKTLIRVQKPANTSGAPSRDGSRAQSPHHANLADEGQPEAQQYTATLPTVSRAYSHDPLADIPSRPMADFMDQTFIAPPNYNFQTNDFEPFLDDASLDQSVMSDNPADWITMPLDGIINSGDANVDQGFHSIGPMVGSRDMLEVLTNQDYNGMQDFNHMAWASPTTPYQGFNNG